MFWYGVINQHQEGHTVSWDQLLRLLVMLLALGVYAGGAAAVSSGGDDGAPIAVFETGDEGGDDEGEDDGEGEDEEPMSDDAEVDDDDGGTDEEGDDE